MDFFQSDLPHHIPCDDIWLLQLEHRQKITKIQIMCDQVTGVSWGNLACKIEFLVTVFRIFQEISLTPIPPLRVLRLTKSRSLLPIAGRAFHPVKQLKRIKTLVTQGRRITKFLEPTDTENGIKTVARLPVHGPQWDETSLEFHTCSDIRSYF
jgi:hypothetical protein